MLPGPNIPAAIHSRKRVEASVLPQSATPTTSILLSNDFCYHLLFFSPTEAGRSMVLSKMENPCFLFPRAHLGLRVSFFSFFFPPVIQIHHIYLETLSPCSLPFFPPDFHPTPSISSPARPRYIRSGKIPLILLASRMLNQLMRDEQGDQV